MNTKLFPALTAATIVLGIGMAVFAAEPGDRASRKAAPPNGLYTCPMHPEIRWSKPDDCPICGMTLTSVKAKKQLPKVDGAKQEEVQMDHGSMEHDGMRMDQEGMGSMTMGCGMCMEMMDMGGMQHGTVRNAPAPAARKIPAQRHRGRGRGPGRGGCGC